MSYDTFGIKDRQMNKAVLASMPDNPARGSYWWWAKLCREYSGASFLDSGSAYGRMHSAPMPGPDSPRITITTWNGYPETATISLPHWLSIILDASDEQAEAVEELLFWYGDLRPRDSWDEVMEDFFPLVNMLIEECVGERGYDLIVKWKHLRAILEKDGYEFDKSFFKREWLVNLYDCELKLTGSGYTYNSENDFSQDFIYYGVTLNKRSRRFHEQPDLYIIRTHNGCDARGGFSSPRVGAVVDDDYFHSFQAEVWSTDNVWNMYNYTNRMGNNPGFPPMDELSDGPELEFVKRLYLDAGEPDDFEWPWMLIHNDGGYELPSDEGYQTYDAENILLWDPELRMYRARLYHEVEGF